MTFIIEFDAEGYDHQGADFLLAVDNECRNLHAHFWTREKRLGRRFPFLQLHGINLFIVGHHLTNLAEWLIVPNIMLGLLDGQFAAKPGDEVLIDLIPWKNHWAHSRGDRFWDMAEGLRLQLCPLYYPKCIHREPFADLDQYFPEVPAATWELDRLETLVAIALDIQANRPKPKFDEVAAKR